MIIVKTHLRKLIPPKRILNTPFPHKFKAESSSHIPSAPFLQNYDGKSTLLNYRVNGTIIIKLFLSELIEGVDTSLETLDWQNK